jgi:hypothetical protein
MPGIEEEPEHEPLLEITVTVWNGEEEGMLTAIVHMGHHELGRIDGKDLRDVLVAAGKTVPRAA